MALSKTYIQPTYPQDMSTRVVDKIAAAGASFTPGTLVVEVSGVVVPCDTDTAVHNTLPAYFVWTDTTQRVDINRVQLDGTRIVMVTCLAGEFKADLATSLFTATPVAGDIIVKSATAGKLDPVSVAEYNTLVGTGTTAAQNLLKVGVVEGPAVRAGSGFWNCTLRT